MDGNRRGSQDPSRPSDHERDQQRSDRSGTPTEGEAGRQGGPPAAPSRRNEVELVPDSREDLRLLKRQDPKAHREVDQMFDKLELKPDLGYELRDEWEGCRAIHVGRDRYRVIWEVLDPEPDYTGVADEVVPVVILRVGPKTDAAGRTIYDRGRPDSP
jgi:mRNA-degrading endonuclease RelE of RelBE toxin-antitoxin system